MTSRNAFLKTLRHQLLNRTEQKQNRPLTTIFSLPVWKNSLGTILINTWTLRTPVHRIKLFQLGGWIINQGYYSMTFHSELQIVRLIFEGGVSSIVDSMHDVMRRGRGGSQRHSDVTLGKNSL